MIKYINYLLLLLAFVLFISLETGSKISTNLHSMLQSSEEKEMLEEFLKFQTNKKILIAIKGTDKESLALLQKIEAELSTIKSITKEEFSINTDLLNYKQQYQLYLNEVDTKKLDSLDIKVELQKLYRSLFDSFLISDVNTTDPFKIIQNNPTAINIKNGNLFFKEYGYFSIFQINQDNNTLEEYENIYDKVQMIENKYENMNSFSSIYYFVENSRFIKNDAQSIMILASCILLVLYLIFLQNLNLLLNTLSTLAFSVLIASIILTILYDEVSIFIIVFGIPISTIAVDYMFHHYFHDYYKKYLGFNKEVFFGFLTTFIVFFILSFTDFLLIKQIALFSMLSLLCSYIIFSVIYPHIEFTSNPLFFHIKKIELLNIKYILVVSIVVFIYTIQNINFDFNLESLNYNNKTLQEKELFFKKQLAKKDQQIVLIKAKTIEKLITYRDTINTLDKNAESSLDVLMSTAYFEDKKEQIRSLKLNEVKKNIDKFSTQIGFKNDAFKDAYLYEKEIPHYTFDTLIALGVEIKKYKDNYIVPIYISTDKIENVSKLDFVYPINLKVLFERSLKNNVKELLFLGVLSLLFILLIIILITKRKILYALTFLSFPASLIFLYFSFVNVNILHIFMLFIVLAISIDYAIYSCKDNSEQTKKAILFSALSSFAGFGVLVFSSTASLYSIGSVASLGIIAILILILFTKVKNES